MMRREDPVRIREALLPLAVSGGLVVAVRPSLWLRDAIPALTDLPGHLLPPLLLADDLLQNGTFGGWRFEWFAGFPLYDFYFPLPGLLIAGLSGLMGDALALRIASFLPVLLMPWSIWAFGCLGGLDRTQRLGAVLVGSTMTLMTSHWIFGGNILAAMAGEFSYAWSLVFLVPYLGWVGGGSGGWRRGALAGSLLAAATLSHIVPPIVAFVGLIPFLAFRRTRSRLLISGGVAAALASFWLVPMAARLGYVGSKGWAFVPTRRDVLPAELYLLFPAAVCALGLLRRRPALATILSVGLAGVLLSVVPQELVHRSRVLPLWFLAVHVLAGVGLARALRSTFSVDWRRAPWAPPFALVGTACLIWVLAARGIDPENHWQAVLEGLPAQPGAQEFDRLVAELETLPPGRIHWESGRELRRWGGAHAFSLLPYWTGHQTLHGLWAESSALSGLLPTLDGELSPEPFFGPSERDVPEVGWAPETAIHRLRLLGVRYLVTHSAEASEAVSLTASPPIGVFGDLRLFDLGPVLQAVPHPCWVGIPEGVSRRAALSEWFRSWRPGSPLMIAGELPDDMAPTASACSAAEPGTAAATAVRIGPASMSFETEAPGVPHLIRVSHFPNWRVEGGRGPWPAGPWFMVVIPDGRSLTLEYRAGFPELLGWTLTVLAVLGIGLACAGVGSRPSSDRSPVSLGLDRSNRSSR